MEKAFALNSSDARVLFELDMLYKRLNKDTDERLQLLNKHHILTEQRDDLYLERITLYNQQEDYLKAKELLQTRKFHPWEGGEGRVVQQYIICCLELAKQAIRNGQAHEALQLLNEAEHYPENLGEGKLAGVQENDIHYWKGIVYDLMEDAEKANHFYKKATEGNSKPVQAVFYNDPQPDKIFYQGLAWKKLKETGKAEAIFNSLIDFGQKHLDDDVHIDYFAVSLPGMLIFDDDLRLRNRIHCLYMMGLGHLGLGNSRKAKTCFKEVLSLDGNHQGVLAHQRMTS